MSWIIFIIWEKKKNKITYVQYKLQKVNVKKIVGIEVKLISFACDHHPTPTKIRFSSKAGSNFLKMFNLFERRNVRFILYAWCSQIETRRKKKHIKVFCSILKSINRCETKMLKWLCFFFFCFIESFSCNEIKLWTDLIWRAFSEKYQSKALQ